MVFPTQKILDLSTTTYELAKSKNFLSPQKFFDTPENFYAASKSSSKDRRICVFVSEQSGILDDAEGGKKTGWRVYGQGAVAVYRKGMPTIYMAGQAFKNDFRA